MKAGIDQRAAGKRKDAKDASERSRSRDTCRSQFTLDKLVYASSIDRSTSPRNGSLNILRMPRIPEFKCSRRFEAMEISTRVTLHPIHLERKC